jgi:hypothetical protein
VRRLAHIASKGSYDMLRSFALLMITLALSSLCAASDVDSTSRAVSDRPLIFAYDVPARTPEFLTSLGIEQPRAVPAQQSCCKICSKGKACGNTCIARDKVCHVGPGCACDG